MHTKVTALLALFAAIAAMAAIASPAKAAANIQTPQKAYNTARVCLLQHGARFVGRRGDNGGFVFFTGVSHIQFWTYKTMLGLVESVTYYAFPGLPATNKRDFIACIMKGN